MMKWNVFRFALTVATAALLLALAPTGPTARAADDSLPNAPELTAEWWQWAYSIPVPQNPLFDETGDLADTAQPYKGSKVFFLVGVINTSGEAERIITVPQGTAFFFPVINVEWDNVGVAKKDRLNVKGLYEVADGFIDPVGDDYFVELDGVSIKDQAARIQSPPFAYKLPDNNIYQFFGTDIVGEVAPAVSDGYWCYLPPLEKGWHVLSFGGSNGSFSLSITYHINVE
jgi:hypothetical protein